MLEAREIKNIDEIALLNRAAAMVDGVYHQIDEELKPGVRENDIVAHGQRAPLRHGLRRRRGDQRDLRRALQSAPAQLHRPHASARATRRSSTSCSRSWAIAPATTAPSTSAARRRRSTTPTRRRASGWTARSTLIKPGVVDRQGRAASWPKAQEFGFPDEMAAFGLKFCHGLGLALHERPIISRAGLARRADRDQGGHGVRGRDLLPGDRRLSRPRASRRR